MRFALATALALVGPIPALAQIAPDSSGPWIHQSFTVREGLPVNAVGTLLQSRDGYLWAATLDGIVRYDGARFTVFTTSVADLPSNRIVSGFEAKDGSLWFRTEQLELIQYQDGKFVHFDPSRGLTAPVVNIHGDSSGRIWIVTSVGVGVIRDERFQPVAPEFRSYSTSLAFRRDGTLWIGTWNDGLYRVHNGRVEPAVPPALLDSATVWALLEDPQGALWIGTSRGLWVERSGALTRVDDANRPIAEIRRLVWSEARRTVYLYSGAGIYRLDQGRPIAIDPRPLPVIVSPFTVDAAGGLWYGVGADVYRDGQKVYTLPAGRVFAESPTITNITIDHEGGIWLATTQGLDRIKPAIFRSLSVAEGLGGRNVYPVHADLSGNVWIGTSGGGLSRIDPDGRITRFGPDRGYPGSIQSIMDDGGGLWVAAGERVFFCALPALRCEPGDDGIPQARIPWVLYKDGADRLWMGTQTGVLLRGSGRWNLIPGWDGSSAVRALLQTRDGALWLGTNGGGLARYENGAFTRITTADGLPTNLVRSLYQDDEGTLWVGTEGRGIAAFDPLEWHPDSSGTGRRIVTIGVGDGLYSETIHQILEDNAGRLWMNTNRGIFWVMQTELRDFVSGRIARVRSTSYTERDGLLNREGNGGMQPVGAKTADGRLWFPTQDGVVIVDPARIAPGPELRAVVERVVTGDSSLVPAGAPVALGVNQRTLQIEYTASSFGDPGNVHFRYRLEPYDEQWIDAGSRRAAFYTRVPPGRYRFRVEAGGGTGEWHEARAGTIDLTLAARFWETPWFRVAFAATLAMLLAASVRWRLVSLRRRALELELVVADRTRQLSTQNTQLERQAAQLGELDRAKSRFFANVSHEFRTPLTLTIGPLEDLRNRSAADPEASRWLDLALRNARRLLRLVNQILDVAKLEAGHMKLVRRHFDLVPFIRGIAAEFEPAARQRGVLLETVGPESLTGAFDSDALEKVLTNLLSNALKFTPPEGRVSVTLNVVEDNVLLAVADTGPGIPPGQLQHVFERFYQADESIRRTGPGTGIGLSLVKELVELHGGSITVESGDGAGGATFTMTLPLETGAAAEPVVPHNGSEPEAGTPDQEEPPAEDNVPQLLVVDDSEDLRTWIRDHFAGRFRVHEAADGAEGITLARQHLPDMVISDVMMPGTDGFELCRALRSSPETDFLPIILLTAKAGHEERIEGLERGADDYLTKPFVMRELEVRVDNLVAQRRRLRERFTRGGVTLPPAPPVPTPRGLDHEDQALVDRIRAAIEANLADPGFGVAELARAVFQDRSHLFRRTRQLLGGSPSDLLRRARIDRAARLLGEGAGTVAEVAYGVGFNNVSHFCHCFQQIHGATPAAYRARVLGR